MILATLTLLHPRFKKLHFNNKIAYSQTISFINDLCTKTIKSSETSTSSKNAKTDNIISGKSSLWLFHHELSSKLQLEQ